MCKANHKSIHKNHDHDHAHNHHHHHDHSHDHHHHDNHHHHDGDDYQNEFDLYPEQFLKLWEESGKVGEILDIREEWEREQIHITGSLSVPMQKLVSSIHQLDPNETYYVLCSQGIRSSFAGRYLVSEGFNHIYNIQSGIFGIYEYAKKHNIKLDWVQTSPDWDLKLV